MTIEIGRPTESAKLVHWMWFHTMPAGNWAVGGRFDDTQVKERKMALARLIAPQGLMTTESKSRLVKEVARALKAALGVGWEEDDTGIFTMCVEIDDGQWGVGAKIPMLSISSEARSLSADAMKCSACSPNVWPRDLLCRRNGHRPSAESMISRVRQLAVGYGLNVV